MGRFSSRGWRDLGVLSSVGRRRRRTRSMCLVGERGKDRRWRDNLLWSFYRFHRRSKESRVWKEHQCEESRSEERNSYRYCNKRRVLCGSLHIGEMVELEEFPNVVSEALGTTGFRRSFGFGRTWGKGHSTQKNEATKTSTSERPRRQRAKRWSWRENGAAWRREKQEEEAIRRNPERWSRRCGSRRWSSRCTSREAQRFEAETFGESARRSRGYHRSGRVRGWWFRVGAFRLCSGSEDSEGGARHRLKVKPLRVKAGHRRLEPPRGSKRKHYEDNLASEEGEVEEEAHHRFEEQEEEIIAAGSRRATRRGEPKEAKQFKEGEEEKQDTRGKGVGEASQWKEDENKGQGWRKQPLREWIDRGWRVGGRGVVIRERSDSSPQEAILEAPWLHPEIPDLTCYRSSGPISHVGDGQGISSDRRNQDGDLLQPVGTSELQSRQQRPERDAPIGRVLGPIEERTVEAAGGLPQCQVSGLALRCSGRLMGGSEALGAASSGGRSVCSHGGPSECKEAREADSEKPRQRRRSFVVKRRRLMELLERRRLERGSPPQGQRRKRQGWKERQRERRWLEIERLEQLERQESRLVEGSEGHERQQGREGEGIQEGVMAVESARKDYERSYEGGKDAPLMREGFRDFRRIAEVGKSLKEIGCLLCWLVLAAESEVERRRYSRGVWSILSGLNAGSSAVRRLPKGVFPLRLGGMVSLMEEFRKRNFFEVRESRFVELWAEDAWLFNTIQVMNYLHGSRAMSRRRWRAVDREAVESLRGAVKRTLAQDTTVERSADEVQKELSCRFLSYSGEEVPKMEVLTVAQVLPALPPVGHGGCIPVTDWLEGNTKTFMNSPKECICPDVGQGLPKLQAKVHIAEKDKQALCELLCERGVCTWVNESEVFRYRNQRVLNGMFGVPKSSTLPDGRACLRCIMNLIPSNSTMIQLEGCVRELPGITQYLSITLAEGESIQMFQSDMVSAFYLFRLPTVWHKFLCFNICFDGKLIGRTPGNRYYLACSVLPMGWTSAVSVMQELSTQLLVRWGLDTERQIKRTKPIPGWLTKILRKASSEGSHWWHVYLDNFFSGERILEGEKATGGEKLHLGAEAAWADANVLSSEKKKSTFLTSTDELGARFDGNQQTLGASGERLIKLLQATSIVLSETAVQRKWLQVIAGRWVHVMQFKRMGMSVLHKIWKWISGKRLGGRGVLKAREELFMCMMGICVFHTFLGSGISDVASASDASNRGGAVGAADTLTSEGEAFIAASEKLQVSPNPKVPVLVVSMFNGIGAAFRCYDVLGVEPAGLISFEIFPPANRVCSRRWPHATFCNDVKDIDISAVRQWLFRYPHITQLHLWAGFPCVDLSSVRFGRKNLRGKNSGLFFEILRVLRLIREVFGSRVRVYFFIENVSSMDPSAAEEISEALGVRPYKLQCADVVPVSRPRYCWSNASLNGLPGLGIIEKSYFAEVTMQGPFPHTSQWLRPDSTWEYESSGVVFPTCMKCVAKSEPPPAPAGISRCDSHTISRWECDEFRYPPYQYKPEYIIWSSHGWRLLDSQERELLHGFGFDHTSPCLSASDIKRSLQQYEDLRCTLVGDCFSVFSFVIFPWAALKEFLPEFDYTHLWNRMGMAPGFCAPFWSKAPLERKLNYGLYKPLATSVNDLTRLLLTKVNHTGSDVRVTTGQIMAPKAFPRQSASPHWWNWKPVFHSRWQTQEHINLLEMRAIMLALRWRVCHLKEADVRFCHLTDSYVCMSVLSKGRSSSDMLMVVLRKVAAFCLCFGLLPILLHVESTENPTDEASRA